MASVSLARRHRTTDRGAPPIRSDRTLDRPEGRTAGKVATVTKEAVVRPSDVTRVKGFRVEYCHINDEFVATIKDTDFMEAAKSMDKAIEKLGRIVRRRIRPSDS